jgi:type I restriction enzyme R subunit
MASSKTEASARIKINKLLEDAGWRFEDDEHGKVNIQLESGVKYSELGDDFEHLNQGFIDFLLLDTDGRPLVVLEAKREAIEPLSAKEQARNYARNVNARFIILSNGNIHYLWDTKYGNPETISRFPTQESITQFETFIPNPEELANEQVHENYVVASQMPTYANDPSFQDDATRPKFLKDNNLKQLRPYQVQAIESLQRSAREGKSRFLFEMATGTGKTLTSAAVIKLFLKTGNARRVLFLVDRIELEDQAQKAFKQYLGKDYHSVIYKEARDSWRHAQVVVSTIQTFLAGDRYRKEFSPTDFEFVISDEAHRSIGGNSRAVFEYFVGYKLGLTATPKDYLKGFDKDNPDTQREFERRQLLNTYTTFGCEAGEPTFRYDLLAGVQDGYLINPIIVDARTDITTQLLSDDGLSVHKVTDDGESVDEIFNEKHWEKKFFNEETNVALCKAFLDNGMLDPVAKEMGVELFGKSIVFCASQRHAAKVTNILNKLAIARWGERYGQSDFAVQVTSQVRDAQQMTINFSNNQLSGKVQKPEGYDSSKTRVAVTVGMMTTGYDCQDILNLALMRPVFSPTDFVQIKGRGTRKFTFEYNDYDANQVLIRTKERFKFFDFFATCEYFENEFPYDEKIKLPHVKKVDTEAEEKETGAQQGEFVDENGKKIFRGPLDLQEYDEIATVSETHVGPEGTRIDREGFRRAIEEDVKSNETLMALWENGDTHGAEEYVRKNVFEKPKHFLSLDKIRSVFNLDRRVTVREFLEVAFGEKDTFETRDELIESEWSKFQEVHDVPQQYYAPVKSYFNAYVVDPRIREIIDNKTYAELFSEPALSFEEFDACNGYKDVVPQYVKDYVPLNTFMD